MLKKPETEFWILIDCHHSSFASRLWIGLAGTLWRRVGVKASKAVGLVGMMGCHWQRLPKPSGTSIDLPPYAWPIDAWWCKMLQLSSTYFFNTFCSIALCFGLTGLAALPSEACPVWLCEPDCEPAKGACSFNRKESQRIQALPFLFQFMSQAGDKQSAVKQEFRDVDAGLQVSSESISVINSCGRFHWS